MPTKYTHVNERAIYYHYAGRTTLPGQVPDFSRGRKLVFVHSAGGNGHYWHHQIERLGHNHSPVVPDLPGHGRSSGVEGLFSVAEYSDFLARFMDALEIRSAVIGGHSMGGAVAMNFAVRYPDRAEALVLVATAAKFAIAQDRVEGLRAVMMGRAPQAFTTDAYSPRTVNENFAVVREGWMEQSKTDPCVRYTDVLACVKADLRAAIAEIERPTLILAGADDTITPVADAEAIRAAIRGARMEVIAGAGHALLIERPVEAASAIEKFLAEPGPV